MRYRRIVGVGLCVLDHVFAVDRLDLAETRIRFREHRVGGGGMVATALAQAAQLGCDAHLVSMVGDDAEGRRLARELRALGVKTRRLLRSARASTTVAVVLVARRGGERRLVVPDRRALERAAPDFALPPVDARSILLVDGHFPRQALRAARRAREAGAVVIADFHRPRPEALRLLPFVDYPIVPREFSDAWGRGGPRQTLRALRERCGGTPILTQGAAGGLYLEDGRVRRFRAHRVVTRDTTGAGDAFHGAFAAGIYRGWDLARALDLGARAAALNCTALGARGRLMTLADLRSRRG